MMSTFAPDPISAVAASVSEWVKTSNHTPRRFAPPLSRGDFQNRKQPKSPLERGTRRAGCVGLLEFSHGLVTALKFAHSPVEPPRQPKRSKQ